MSYDFVVIGAGISGITSAITLAQKGHRVVLLEKAERTAPLLRGFSRQGVHFDTGFHYAGGLGAGGPLSTFFRYLGLSDAITSFPFDENGFDIFQCQAENFEFRFPTGLDRIKDELVAAFPRERQAIESYLARISSICAAMPYQNLDAPMDSDAMMQMVFGPTLKETLDLLTRDPLLKSLLSMHTLLYGVPSDQVPFAQHAVIVGNYYHSARGIRGGGLSLAEACDARMKQLGIEVICGSEVTGISASSDGAFTGVQLAGGESISGRGCIATLHPRRLLDLVPEATFRPSYRKRIWALEETVSAFLSFAVSAVPLPSLAGANRFLLPDVGSIHEIGRRPVGDTPIYLSGAYRRGEVIPSGFIGIFPANFSETACFADSSFGKRPVEYRQFKEQALDRMRRQLERLCPDLAQSIDSIEASTPLTVRHFCDSHAGGLYGVKHRIGQHNPLPATKLKGLYLAGQALVAPGVMGAALSGLMACGAVLGHEQIREELKACC